MEGNSNNFSSIPDVVPLENHPESLNCYISHLGTIIPNRIYVGGIDQKVNERDLRSCFSHYGTVKNVKIVIDHSGMSKGYGFVTFETQEEALKTLSDVNVICINGKMLNIGQAVRKHQTAQQIKVMLVASPNPAMYLPVSCGHHYFTPTGHPYTYHNGVAYFVCPNLMPPAQHWPCVPSHCEWNVVQHLISSSPVINSQELEYMCQPTSCRFI